MSDKKPKRPRKPAPHQRRTPDGGKTRKESRK